MSSTLGTAEKEVKHPGIMTSAHLTGKKLCWGQRIVDEVLPGEVALRQR